MLNFNGGIMKYLLLLLISFNAFAVDLYKCGISNMPDNDGYFVMSSDACDVWFESQKNNHECIGGGCLKLKQLATAEEIALWEQVTALGD
jgi:hypothetical protein